MSSLMLMSIECCWLVALPIGLGGSAVDTAGAGGGMLDAAFIPLFWVVAVAAATGLGAAAVLIDGACATCPVTPDWTFELGIGMGEAPAGGGAVPGTSGMG